MNRSRTRRIQFIIFTFVKKVFVFQVLKYKLSKFCIKLFALNIKLVFTSFKIKSYFSNKDPVLDDLRSFLVYKCTCGSCSSSYLGKTRIEEHIKKDNKSHIFKHLHPTATCFDWYTSLLSIIFIISDL